MTFLHRFCDFAVLVITKCCKLFVTFLYVDKEVCDTENNLI